jgi:hypothetical protein
MFNSTEESGRENDAIAHGNQPQPDARVADSLAPGTGIELRSLPPGTALLVDTRNSRYRLLMLDGDGRKALVQGGRYFCQEAEAQIGGSTLGGSLLKVGWIYVGLCLELTVGGKSIVTTRVRSITVEPLVH